MMTAMSRHTLRRLRRIYRKLRLSLLEPLLFLLLCLLCVAVGLILLPVLLAFLPFRLLPCLYARNIHSTLDGVIVYSILGGEHSRHTWSEIEAFWIFPISGGFPPIQQWQLVLKDRRTIPLPLVRGKTIWKICESQGVPTNLWDSWPSEEREIRKARYLPGGRYLF